MVFLYASTNDNKIAAVEVDDDTGSWIQLVQTLDPLVDPLPNVPNVKLTGMMNRPATEWIVHHPKFDLLYALTSFMSNHPAYVTTFRVNQQNGTLEKLGVTETGGLQAAHAAFSPDASTLVIAHHNDGNLSFFDCSRDDIALSKQPLRIIQTPEVRPETRTTKFPANLPSLHQVCYAPNGKYLLTVDSSAQSRIWTYAVDKRGLPISSEDTPTFKQKCAPIRKFPGQLVSLLSQTLFKTPSRLRRVAIHPTGQYVYVLYESHSVVQVYEITPKGKIIADCLQELPTIDDSFFNSWRPVGIAVNSAGEMAATPEGVWVSNRGNALLGRAESSIRFFPYVDGGSGTLGHTDSVVLEVAGPVRHFLLHQDKLYSGVNKEKTGMVETFTRQDDGTYQKTGQAEVGMDVFCVAVGLGRPQI